MYLDDQALEWNGRKMLDSDLGFISKPCRPKMGGSGSDGLVRELWGVLTPHCIPSNAVRGFNVPKIIFGATVVGMSRWSW